MERRPSSVSCLLLSSRRIVAPKVNSFLPNSKMAAAMELAMASAMPDLKFLLDREGVAADLQVKFFEAGIVNLRQFAAFAPDAEEMRKSLKEDFALDPAAGLPTKIAISKVMVAWESAKIRSQKLAEAEAEAEIRQLGGATTIRSCARPTRAGGGAWRRNKSQPGSTSRRSVRALSEQSHGQRP